MKQWFLGLRNNFNSRTNLKKASINTSWLLSEQICRLLVGFFISILTARYLGPNGLGLFNYSLAFVSMFSILATLGLDNIVIKKLVELRSNTGEIMGTAFLMKFVGGIVSLVVTFIAVCLVQPGRPEFLLMVTIMASGNLFLGFGVVDFYYQSHLKAKYTSMVRVGTYIVVTLLKFWLIISKQNIYYFGALIALEVTINAMTFGFLFFKREKIKLSFSPTLARELFTLSLPIFLSMLMVGIYSKIDQIFVGGMLSKEIVGFYSLAASLIQIFYFVPTIINNSVFPILLQENINRNFVSYKSKVNKTLVYLITAGILLAILANIFSGFLIKLLYGNKFLATIGLLKIYSWNLVFVFASSILNNWLIIENKQKYILYFQMVVLVVDFCLGYWLVKNIGVNGAAITSLVGNALIFCLYYLYFWHKNNNER